MRPAASRAPRWAMASMPRAPPLTTTTPDAAETPGQVLRDVLPQRARAPRADHRDVIRPEPERLPPQEQGDRRILQPEERGPVLGVSGEGHPRPDPCDPPPDSPDVGVEQEEPIPIGARAPARIARTHRSADPTSHANTKSRPGRDPEEASQQDGGVGVAGAVEEPGRERVREIGLAVTRHEINPSSWSNAARYESASATCSARDVARLPGDPRSVRATFTTRSKPRPVSAR